MKYSTKLLHRAASYNRPLGNHVIILCVRAYPKPEYSIVHIDAHCAVVQANAHGAEPTDVLKAERWMTGVGFEELETLIGERLDVWPGDLRSSAKSVATRNASTRTGASCAMIRQSLVGQTVESARLGIRFELMIPGRGIELDVPAPKLAELLLRQRCDLAFELLDPGHT